MAIPKIIHQTTSDTNFLHPLIEKNIVNLVDQNPDWDYRLYDDGDHHRFIKKNFGASFLRLYEKIDIAYGPARADFFRYLLMYQHGGVYLDIKSTAKKSLNEVLTQNDSYILSHWHARADGAYQGWGKHPEFGIDNEFQQWHIIAEPRHPFLERVIQTVKYNLENYDPVKNGVGQLGVLSTTGPIAYTRALFPILGSYAYRLVDIASLGIEYSIFATSSCETNHIKLYSQHYTELTIPIVKNS